jgi:aminomethyltransferase
MLKRTALFEEHRKLGGKLVDFGGWELPIQYSGVMAEHLACRSACGIFDVSHMGEIAVEGEHAEAFLNRIVTNDVRKAAVGQAQYTVVCHENGGIVDDWVFYRRAQDRFFVVVNASNTEKSFRHLLEIQARLPEFQSVRILNQSDQYSQIALQGRKAQEILSSLTLYPLDSIRTYFFAETKILGEIPVILGRTGYTGEDGFEIYCPWDRGPEVWRAMIEAGKPAGLLPCGLGARDTLRTEMKYSLYGHELTDQTNPLEAGLGWVVKLDQGEKDKGDFVGRSALESAKKSLKRKLVGVRMIDRGIARAGYPILSTQGEKIGEVTSGTQAPSLNAAIAIGYVPVEVATPGAKIAIEIRGTPVSAEIVATPFYKRTY